MAGTRPPEHDSRAGRGSSASLSRLLIGGGFWSLLGRFGQSFVMLAGTVVLARLLTPGDFGVIAISTSLTVLMLVIADGFIDFPILRSNDLDEDRLRSLLWACFAIMTASSAVVIVAAPTLEALFGFAGLAGVLRATCPIFFFQAVMVTGRAIMRRQHRFRDAGLFLVVSAAIYVVVAIAGAVAGWGYWSLVAGQIALHFAMAVQFAFAARLSLRWPRRFDLSGLAATGSYGLASRVFAWFWSAVDTIAVGLSTSAAATGLYSRAYNLSTQAKEPFVALDHPIRQALIAKRERDGSIATLAPKILRLVTIGTSLVAASLVLFRELVVEILLGPQWGGVVVPLAILVAGLPARIALNFIDSAILVSGRMAHMLRRHIFMCVLVGGGVAAAASWGIVAVACVVTAALYIALPVAVDTTGESPPLSRRAVLLAIAPGMAIGGLLVIAGEAIGAIWPWGELGLAAVIAALFAVCVVALAVFLPEAWTFPEWTRRRNRIVRAITDRVRPRRRGKPHSTRDR
ncbi:oligosaccharide flippase family protein [Pelagerythrobacter sp.]|uniref:oligosaccharide flippase family protein n=1 Tax=Pelagerythrobacter sp. TaxID=2800702 RepID=UPI0035B48F1A